MTKRGRKKTTGRYDTREELVREVMEDVRRWYDGDTDWSLTQIAKYHGVSQTTVANIEREYVND